ncbi:MAG: RHS repeat-associated core domain-containing protein [Chloroflexota bacterium]
MAIWRRRSDLIEARPFAHIPFGISLNLVMYLNNFSFSFQKTASSPYINRFLSADTIVPGAANPQALNRYSYTLNNPLRYTDPTGHMAVSDTNEAGCSGGGPACIIEMYGGYCDDDGMADSLRSYVRRHKDYNPATDTDLSIEDQATVSIAMFQVAADDAYHAPQTNIWDILKSVLPSAELIVFSGMIIDGLPKINMSPDEWSGGRPSNNYAQNRQFKGAVSEIESQLGRKLNQDEIRQIHDSLHHLEDPGFWDIVKEGLNLFGK